MNKPRFVSIRVDDERVTEINLEYRDQDGYLGVSVVPVPLDDQLTRDAENAVSSLLWEAAALRHKAADEPMPDRTRSMYQKADALDASAARLRAEFSLDQEDAT